MVNVHHEKIENLGKFNQTSCQNSGQAGINAINGKYKMDGLVQAGARDRQTTSDMQVTQSIYFESL